MRLSLIILIILLLPGLALGIADITRDGRPAALIAEGAPEAQVGDQPIVWSTLGQVWLEYHRSSYMDFRDQYIGKTEEWNQNVLPYLELKAVPVALGPGILLGVYLIIAWLLGFGQGGYGRSRFSEPSTPFGRPHVHRKGSDLKYTRK
jgi:hypothetical protein